MARLNLKKLKVEIDSDPLARGYAAMTDQEVADDMNLVIRERQRETVTGGEVFAVMPEAGYDNLTAAQGAEWLRVCAIAEHDPYGLLDKIVTRLFATAGETAFDNLRKTLVSRNVELSIWKDDLIERHVTDARALV